MIGLKSDTAIELKSETLRRVYHDWDLRRGLRRFPARGDIDPIDFKYVLGRITLLDVLRDPLDYRYRLCGSITAARYGVDMTKRCVSEIPSPELRDAVRSHLDEVLRLEAPVARFYDRTCLDGWVLHSEVIVLPLSRDQCAIDMLMTASVHF